MAIEIYQIGKCDNLTELTSQLNDILFTISKRLANLNIPNEDIASATDVDSLIEALQNSGVAS